MPRQADLGAPAAPQAAPPLPGPAPFLEPGIPTPPPTPAMPDFGDLAKGRPAPPDFDSGPFEPSRPPLPGGPLPSEPTPPPDLGMPEGFFD